MTRLYYFTLLQQCLHENSLGCPVLGVKGKWKCVRSEGTRSEYLQGKLDSCKTVITRTIHAFLCEAAAKPSWFRQTRTTSESCSYRCAQVWRYKCGDFLNSTWWHRYKDSLLGFQFPHTELWSCSSSRTLLLWLAEVGLQLMVTDRWFNHVPSVFFFLRVLLFSTLYKDNLPDGSA